MHGSAQLRDVGLHSELAIIYGLLEGGGTLDQKNPCFPHFTDNFFEMFHCKLIGSVPQVRQPKWAGMLASPGRKGPKQIIEFIAFANLSYNSSLIIATWSSNTGNFEGLQLIHFGRQQQRANPRGANQLVKNVRTRGQFYLTTPP